MSLAHSKTRITRAGELLRRWWMREIELDEDDLWAEVQIINAFRGAHQQPLTRVAANLRYYLRTQSFSGQLIVAQRLKRSMAHPEQYFILLHNVADREVEIIMFGRDADRAVDAYSEYERAHRGDDAIEVVMVGADSIETIQKTHSHYFAKTDEELLDQFLAGH